MVSFALSQVFCPLAPTGAAAVGLQAGVEEAMLVGAGIWAVRELGMALQEWGLEIGVVN